MPTPTYDLIQEQVLGSAAASVTFSSIPGTYKDLVLEFVGSAASTADTPAIRFNGDTATNYSATSLAGNGTTATSQRQSNVNRIQVGGFQDPVGTTPSTLFVNVQSYTSTNVFKTVIARHSNFNGSAGTAGSIVGLWRKSPAEAITSITVLTENGNSYATNSTFRLWGVSG